jgi:predicted nucleotidyltransferase component of viral defense system
MDKIDFKLLYSLQDQVMMLIFETENIFYLTGGTCLGRFYKEKRYSDDLDFFTNQSPRYNFAVRNIKNKLKDSFKVSAEVESKDFNRFRINDLLQIDFINDIAFRYGDIIVTNEGFLIDNVFNILSNKLTAVIGRDDPKDIFDIYLISKYYSFSWNNILDAAHQKAVFSDEELIVRLKTFPKELFKNIKLIDTKFLDDFDVYFPKIIDEIYEKKEHQAIET